jgi:hypothetical protein
MKACGIVGLIIIAVVCFGLCYKWGDWKNWKLYYPTILFYIIATLTAHILMEKQQLWSVHVLFDSDMLADYFMSCILFPPVVILFLCNYPKQITKKIMYIFVFVFTFSLTEYIAGIQKAITYGNKWNFISAILLYIGTFIMLPLHHKKPLFAWLILFAMAVGAMFYFHIFLSDLK